MRRGRSSGGSEDRRVDTAFRSGERGLDWGIGGLGLLGQLAPQLPIVYWSDTGAVPYGKQPPAELAARLRAVIKALAARDVSHVVLACNAASTVVERLGDVVIPVEGIIDHGVAAVPAELRGTLGIIGGRRTILAGVYRRRLARPGRTVVSRVAQPAARRACVRG